MRASIEWTRGCHHVMKQNHQLGSLYSHALFLRIELFKQCFVEKSLLHNIKFHLERYKPQYRMQSERPPCVLSVGGRRRRVSLSSSLHPLLATLSLSLSLSHSDPHYRSGLKNQSSRMGGEDCPRH